MNKRKISTYIRMQNALRAIIPLIIFIGISVTIHVLNINSYLFPKYIDISNLDKASNPYVTTTLTNLRYTGLNYTSGGKADGGYYYYFVDNICHYVVLKPDSEGNFRDSIDQITVTGKITNNPDEIHHLTNLLAKELNWNDMDLTTISNDKILNQYLYHPRLSKAILYGLFLLFAIVVANILFLLLGIICPSISLSTIKKGNYVELNNTLKKAQAELDHGTRYTGNNMYITDNYFININHRCVVVVPLDQIVWIYYHSVLRGSILFKHTISYTLRVVTEDKNIYVIPNKSKDKCVEVMDIISTMYPEILIGYSEENHITFLQRINSIFSKFIQFFKPKED